MNRCKYFLKQSDSNLQPNSTSNSFSCLPSSLSLELCSSQFILIVELWNREKDSIKHIWPDNIDHFMEIKIPDFDINIIVDCKDIKEIMEA